MGLFDKKYCDICGKEIKLLGNRKLDDGNMCKDCAAKLSPWFSGRRHTSVEAIKKQLAYREENQNKLKVFSPNKIIGKRYKVYVDEAKRQFTVSSLSKWREANPDLIDLKDVRNVEITVKEDRDEIYDKDAEGKKISFNPPQYEYEYRFDVRIDVNNEFFDDISFELTDDNPDNPDSEAYREYVQIADDIMMALCSRHFNDDRSQFKYDGAGIANGDEWFCPKCGTKNTDNFCVKCGTPKPNAFTPFFCSKCGEKIEDPGIVFCPKCGNKVG